MLYYKQARQPPKRFVPIQSATPLGALSHGVHEPISIVLRTRFLDAPATRWVARKKSRKATPLPVKVQEWFFYVRNCLITFGSEK